MNNNNNIKQKAHYNGAFSYFKTKPNFQSDQWWVHSCTEWTNSVNSTFFKYRV